MADLVWTPNRAAMQKFLKGPQGPAARAVRRVQSATDAYARRSAPKDTGQLGRSHVKTPIVAEGERVTAGVEATADYALFVHEGTRPHPIVPRRGKFLAWIPRGSGAKTIFARSVMLHPGTKAQPWLAKSAKLAALQNQFRFMEE